MQFQITCTSNKIGSKIITLLIVILDNMKCCSTRIFIGFVSSVFFPHLLCNLRHHHRRQLSLSSYSPSSSSRASSPLDLPTAANEETLSDEESFLRKDTMEYKIINTNSNITQKYEFVNQKLYNTYKHLLAAREAILAGTIGSASAFSARVWEETPPTLLEIMPALRPEGYLDLGDRTEEGGRIASPVKSAVEFPLLYSHI